MEYSITPDSSIWGAQLERSLELRFAEPELSNFVDEILVWFSSVDSDNPDDLGQKLIKFYGNTEFRALFEDCIDRLMISNSSAGIFESCNTSQQAKWRYRKLMSVFHPDKGENTQTWLNFRAEKINRAYQEFEAKQSKNDVYKTTFRERKSKNRRSSSSYGRYSENSISQRRRATTQRQFLDWRKAFGDAQTLERKVIRSLISICLFTLILISLVAYLDY